MNSKIRLRVMSIVMILYFVAEIWLQVKSIQILGNQFAYIIPIYVLYVLCGVIGVVASIKISFKKIAVFGGITAVITEVLIALLNSKMRLPIIPVVYIMLAWMVKEEKE